MAKTKMILYFLVTKKKRGGVIERSLAFPRLCNICSFS